VRNSSALVLLTVAMVGTSGQLGSQQSMATSPDLKVHEWGTFTSVAGPDGSSVEWAPLNGPSDLPCFVTVLNPRSLKTRFNGTLSSIKATVRMETPVLYFYSPYAETVHASVRFPSGLITEWYPASTPIAAGIEWKDIEVLPDARPDFPVDGGQSHYYAARETDAAPLQVGDQNERFLFYRGLANFPVPISATIDRDGAVDVQNTGAHVVPAMILFERDGSGLGYRVVHGAPKRVTLARPELTSTVDSLRQDLQQLLTDQGLYPREAAAMVDTWRDSWFERGTRLFYLFPQASVDAILPLQIAPQPAEVTRVFVGRLELITPEMQTEVERAIRDGDEALLSQYGRFLEPIARRVASAPASRLEETKVQAALRTLAAQYVSPQEERACVTPRPARKWHGAIDQ